MNVQDSRILSKRSTIATTVPTVPVSNDHTDGSWTSTDIYKGEFFKNLFDGKLYTRFDSGIKRIALFDDITDTTTASNGLTKTGNNITLGGAFTQNTTINGAFDLILDIGTLTFGTSAKFLNTDFSIQGSGNTIATYAIKVQDSVSASIFELNNSGDVKASTFNIGAYGVSPNGQKELLNVVGNGAGVPFIHGFFSNGNTAGRTQFAVSSESYPSNFMIFETHGSGYLAEIYATNKAATTDAGMAMILAQGASITALAIGTYEANPLYLMTSNTIRFFLEGNGNVGYNGQSYGGGVGALFLANATTVPTTNPVGGGILYTDGGALKYRGSSGTLTTIAVS